MFLASSCEKFLDLTYQLFAVLFSCLLWYYVLVSVFVSAPVLCCGHTCFSTMQDRPSTKVHAAPGGGSSLGYLFGGAGNGN